MHHSIDLHYQDFDFVVGIKVRDDQSNLFRLPCGRTIHVDASLEGHGVIFPVVAIFHVHAFRQSRQRVTRRIVVVFSNAAAAAAAHLFVKDVHRCTPHSAIGFKFRSCVVESQFDDSIIIADVDAAAARTTSPSTG